MDKSVVEAPIVISFLQHESIGVDHVDIRDRADHLATNARLTVYWDGDVPVAQAYYDEQVPDQFGTPETLPPDPQGSVSVVICTRDRPDELARCLASLPQQTLVPDEIIVVDNASVTDETRQVAQAAGVRYVREDRPGLDIARNTGAKSATGDFVAYTDDDVILTPNWLRRLTGAMDTDDIWGTTGLVLPAELVTPAQLHFERQWGFGRGFSKIDFGPEFVQRHDRFGIPAWDVGAGASMAFRRAIFDKIGFFDERLDVGAAGCSGDSEMWHRILHAGGTCRYTPTSVAFHYHRRAEEGLRKQLRAYMSGHVAALLVQNERSGRRANLRRLYLSLPIHYLRETLRKRREDEPSRYLKEQVLGCIDGWKFYRNAPRPDEC
ncbi:glycosyltransferase family 2 protein [Parvularcula sp. LCG005]|uniref:glycosyltransferase family 2 protein n=1 Tax=Parvularcula sp. LCG005 TaxID=3078805 RepID=UPI0029439AB2|nr:glycosyltransferase [Parvularcula sp. LCG005]WOI54046.1 glycosyltransferase [Parvularcula sp. LCG005]